MPSKITISLPGQFRLLKKLRSKGHGTTSFGRCKILQYPSSNTEPLFRSIHCTVWTSVPPPPQVTEHWDWEIYMHIIMCACACVCVCVWCWANGNGSVVEYVSSFVSSNCRTLAVRLVMTDQCPSVSSPRTPRCSPQLHGTCTLIVWYHIWLHVHMYILSLLEQQIYGVYMCM